MKRLLLLLIFSILVFSSCTSSKEETIEIPVYSTKEETLSALEKSYNANKSSLVIGYDYAYALAAEGNYEDAISVIDNLSLKHVDSLRLQYLKLYALRQGGYDIKKTLEDILSFDKGNIDILLLLAEYHLDNGNEKKAKSYLMDIIYRDINNSKALSLLAKIDPFYKAIEIVQPATQADNTVDPAQSDTSQELTTDTSTTETTSDETAQTAASEEKKDNTTDSVQNDVSNKESNETVKTGSDETAQTTSSEEKSNSSTDSAQSEVSQEKTTDTSTTVETTSNETTTADSEEKTNDTQASAL